MIIRNKIAIFCIAIAALSMQISCDNTKSTDANTWIQAERKFGEYITPQLIKYRSQLKSLGDREPYAEYVEVRSELLSKYLPDYRFYVVDCLLTRIDNTFLVKQDGAILNLGDGTASPNGDSGYYQIPKIPDFIKTLKIQVIDGNRAIEITKLFDELRFASLRVSHLRVNTNNHRIYDESILADHLSYNGSNGSSWKYGAEKKPFGWRVTREYTGSGASVSPPIYDLYINSPQILQDIFQLNQ